MPHFFFHLHDGKARRADSLGVALPDAEAAWYQAYRHARDIVAVRQGDRRQWLGQSLEVEDDNGGPVWSMPLIEIAELVT